LKVPARSPGEKEKVSNHKGAQSIHRAVALIRAVGRHNDHGAPLSLIARETGLHVATAHRVLSVLTAEGFISCHPGSKLYQLGIDLHLLAGSALQFGIRNLLRSALEKIADKTGDTVFLLIRSGNDALCIDRVEGKSPIRTVPVDVGARRPLGIGAGSMALMAFLPLDQVELIIAANTPRYPQFKKITHKDIRSLAETSRAAGYVVSVGLFHDEVTSIGIPIQNKNGNLVAAITVTSISQRMDRKRQQKIFEIVKRIARDEGYRPAKPFKNRSSGQ
jgi:DNA-binding IclR family transcriptional regulator